MSARRLAACAAASFLLIAPGAGADDGLRCSAPPELTRFRVPLPNTARAIRRGRALVIVAIGSSSTEGVGASDPAHSYPARLAADLRRRWPRLAVTVVNKGVGGEQAAQMLERFERDVLPYRPQLVIWQTGSNQVLRGGDVDAYTRAVRKGVGRLQAAGIDVVLMDLQFAPRVLARPTHVAVVDSIGAVANDLKVAVFRRFAVMRHWVTSGQYRVEDVISRDGLHMNDASYGCIARLLADSLATAAREEAAAPEEDRAPPGGTRGSTRPTP